MSGGGRDGEEGRLAVDARLVALIRSVSAAPLELPATPFFFLRHGQTDGNRLRIIQAAEQPLNEHGFAQAERGARILRGQPVRRILASTMTRARQTADAVARALALPVTPVPGLREKWFGDWVGSSSVGLDWSSVPPNGESLADFVHRTRRAVEDCLRDGADGTLLVAHGGTLYVLAAGLGLPVTDETLVNATPLRFSPAGAGASGGWRVERLAEPPEDDRADSALA